MRMNLLAPLAAVCLLAVPPASAATKTSDSAFGFTFSFTGDATVCGVEGTYTWTETFWGRATFWDNGKFDITTNLRGDITDASGSLVARLSGQNPLTTGTGSAPMSYVYRAQTECVGSGHIDASYECNFHIDNAGNLVVNQPEGC